MAAGVHPRGPRGELGAVPVDLAENGRFEILCALGVVLLATMLVFVFIGQVVVGRDFMVRRDA
jgi:hypothetical protein